MKLFEAGLIGVVIGVVIMLIPFSIITNIDSNTIEKLGISNEILKNNHSQLTSRDVQRKEMAQWLEFRQELWDNYVYLAFEFNLSQNSQKETQTLFFGLEKEINKINEIILQILNNLLMERRE